MTVDRFARAKFLTRQRFSLVSIIAVLAAMVSTVLIGPSAAMASDRQAPDRLSAPKAAVAAAPATAQRGPATSAAVRVRAAECGGPLAFGQIVACPSITGDEQHVYTVTTRRNADTLFTQRSDGSGDSITAAITAPNGDFVCGFGGFAGTCQLGAAGTYTITVRL